MSDISGKPLEGELQLINKYTRRELGEEDVYVFSVVLCDNETDRDYEKFSDEALTKLAELYVGVTGIADHDPKCKNQKARIFSCSTEEVSGKVNSLGEPYRRLVARAYIPRSEKSEELIMELESGIKKEVSVGCAVKKRICSVCGEEISLCSHIKGRNYAGKLCYALLCEPEDAYEWSFVAVPAQKAAGVIKAFEKNKSTSDTEKRCERKLGYKGGELLDIEKKLFCGEEQSFSQEEMRELAGKFRSLKKKALDGEYYREMLVKDVRGLSAVVLPELGADTLMSITGELSVSQLNELKKAFESKASEILPLKPQLSGDDSGRKNNNTLYKNI